MGKRDRRIQFMVSAEEEKQIKEMAAQERQTVSSLLRGIIHKLAEGAEIRFEKEKGLLWWYLPIDPSSEE